MRLFDVLGPVMTGPSSSHTAGAVRIGLTARNLLGEAPKTAEILLHGSFAATGRGHGTDRALVAGLLGMLPDDERIPDSFSLAQQAGLDYTIGTVVLRGAHPNTALLRLEGVSGRKLEVMGASIGGGRINICQIDGITTNFGGDHNTLIVHNQDTPGHVAAVTTCLSQHGVNIAAFIKEFNARTKDMEGYKIPVVITVYADRSFTFITKTPPTPMLIMKAIGLEKGSGVPNKTKVGTITKAQIAEIAKTKMPDLNCPTLEAAESQVAGTCRSMGVTVVD